MPESTIKYYPVLAKILLTLNGKPVVSYRGLIIAVSGEFIANDHLIPRFVTGYKGASFDFAEEIAGDRDVWKPDAIAYLNKKERKKNFFEGMQLEPMVEVEINLRAATVEVLERAA